jgi:polysaccharide export outer membrane protein
MRRTVTLLLTILLTMGPALADPAPPTPFDLRVSRNYMSRNYLLGPNDILTLTVQDAEEFDQPEIRVLPDGRIFLGPVGNLQVGGLTLQAAHELLVEKYSRYLKSPSISLNLKRPRPFILYVTGGVLNPGSYELNTDPNNLAIANGTQLDLQIIRSSPILSNLLVACGGLTHDADLEHIEVTNSIDGTRFQVNLLDLLENGNTRQDLYLMAGDRVHVPKVSTPMAISNEHYRKYASASFSPRSVPVKVLGYVNSPGLIRLDSNLGLNVNSAISAAGGYLQEDVQSASYAPRRVVIGRQDENGRLVMLKVDPRKEDAMLRPNDVVYVPDKTRPAVGKAADYVARLLTPAATLGSALNNWATLLDPLRQWPQNLR